MKIEDAVTILDDIAKRYGGDEADAAILTLLSYTARLEIAEKLLERWYKYWNHSSSLTTAEAVDLHNETYSFIKE
jgi:hypothetical protein